MTKKKLKKVIQKKSSSAKPADVSVVLRRLQKHYPDAHCALIHSNSFELLVATILSAQCTDERVNMVTPELFEWYPTPEAMAAASVEDIEFRIRSINFFRNKAKNLKLCAQALVDRHGGEVPQTMEELIELAGVGRKTANVVLGNAFNIASGVVVDTHVARLSQRLGWARKKTPEEIEKDLIKIIPKKDWVMIAHWLIFHGRSICKARKPLCENCFLFDHCPKIGV